MKSCREAEMVASSGVGGGGGGVKERLGVGI